MVFPPAPPFPPASRRGRYAGPALGDSLRLIPPFFCGPHQRGKPAGGTRAAALLARTALLGWSYLADEFPEFGKEDLREAALRVAREAPEGSASQRTALSLCGRYRIAEALPLVRECARRESDLPLRTAAVFALGELGDQSDLQWLRQTAGQAPVVLRAAFQAASVKIESRLSET